MKHFCILVLIILMLNGFIVEGFRHKTNRIIKKRSRVSHASTSLTNTTKSVEESTAKFNDDGASRETTYIRKNSTNEKAEKKNKFEKVQRKQEQKGKDMSAIVVIGNKTHRISGPVVKQLLSELQHQKDPTDSAKQAKTDPTEVGSSGASNLKRLYAANEVAEINKLLGKPLTDAKALGLIKNLLLDKVHNHLAKTMEMETMEVLQPPSNPAPFGIKEGVHGQVETSICRDLDPKEKCLYLKELGLCAEGKKHPRIRRRCQQTCAMCDVYSPTAPQCSDCNNCAGCTSLRKWQIDIHVPYEVLQGNGIPCGNCVPTNHRQSPLVPTPTQHHTTPNPVLVLNDNTPIPGKAANLPNAVPTLHAHLTINAAATIQPATTEASLLRPSAEPVNPTVLRPSGMTRHTTKHLTTHLPTVVHRTTPMRPSLPTRRPVVPTRPITNPVHPSIPVVKTLPTAAPLGPIANAQPSVEVVPPAPPVPPVPAAEDEVVEANRLPAMPPGSVDPVFDAVGKCQLPLDIGIAIDTSAATVPHWQQIQQFTRSLIDKFEMGGVSRIGIITFDTLAKVPVHLGTYNDANTLKQHLNKLQADPYGRRRTDSALDAAKDKLFVSGRPGVPKILFLLEHGRINGGDPSVNWAQMLSEPAQRLRDMGVNVFAVGATPIATLEELKTISSSEDDTHAIGLPNYTHLPAVVEQLAAKACQLAGTLHFPTNIPAQQTPPPVTTQLKKMVTNARIPLGTPHSPTNIPVRLTPALVTTQLKKMATNTHGPYGCPVNYAKLGCYNDDQNNPRPLPEQLVNDRGATFPHYSGSPINWDHWATYLPKFVCRCAMLAKKKGYKIFGIQFFAACWSGPASEQTYMEDGEGDPDMCISTSSRKCEATDSVCAGKQETNFVYSLEAEAKRSNIPRHPYYHHKRHSHKKRAPKKYKPAVYLT
ncbi:uncharacterized protein LOC130635516 isoform X2 [Hydractinia symbiolongicarpus]|uniref:uncharacterized protein LOC130635516 isoform X2 n=1 Tax=Hydractinia symbiolongicarpus TaxID=13093 RepID=UPI00254A538B|nr:uncharacterized protein LOC130635516 isoform X2 [Hydractinia symbiolongicarpus]